jgi:probable HAF family extracellular repeat protein
MQDLGTLPNFVSSEAKGVSGDGSVVVGISTDSNANGRAWRWTDAGGIVDLGGLPGVGDENSADAVNADGSVIVGASGTTAYRWTQPTGMQPLPRLPGAGLCAATSVSADGSVIGGEASFSPTERAVYWDSAGMHDIQAMLGHAIPTGWALTICWTVSDDGRTLAGIGVHNGMLEGWVATIPSPGAGWMIALGFVRLGRRRLRPCAGCY